MSKAMTNNNSDGPPSTYAERASIAEDITGGRFAALGRPMVVGREPSSNYPKLPSSSPWSHDPVPPEEPIDMSAECGPTYGIAMGEPHEVAASLGEVEAPIADNPPAVVETASPNPALARLAEILPRIARPQTFRRRI